MLTGKQQLYRGLLQNISGANASADGMLAYTTDSQGLFVANGTAFGRVAPQNKVWIVDNPADLATLVQSSSGALLGDFAVSNSNNTVYVYVGFANKSWMALTQFNIGDSIIDSNGNLQTVIIEGVTGSIEPTWPTSGITNDGGVVWNLSEGFVPLIVQTVTYSDPLIDGLGAFVFDGLGDLITVLVIG